MNWRKVMTVLLAVGGIFSVLAAADSPAPAPAASPQSELLLFSYFKGNGEDGLHLAWSDDGLNWQALKGDKSFLAPEVGKEKLMRDPSIQLGPDGVFHAVWTCSWNDHGIGYAESKDLIHWSEEKFVPLMENDPATRNCWAPELFYDSANKQWLIVWSSTVPGKFPETDGQDSNAAAKNPGYNHRLYYVTTTDFKTFNATKLLYNPGFNCIDAAIFQDGKKFVLVFKDESNTPFPVQKNLKLAFADAAIGPYGPATAPISPKDARGQGVWSEGPTPIKVGDKWLVLFDKYRDHKYGLITSSDLKNWTDESAKLVVPNGLRHGTVFHAPAEIIEVLKNVE
jgi:hypothetical protein